MKRRGSYGQQRLQRLAIGVGLLLFLAINIYIYLETHKAAARGRGGAKGAHGPKAAAAGQPSSASSSSSAADGSASARKDALEVESGGSGQKQQPAVSSSDGPTGGGSSSSSSSAAAGKALSPAFVHNTTIWPYRDMDDMLQGLVDRKFWGPEVPLLPTGHYDFANGVYTKPAMKEAYDVQARVFELTGCNSVNVPFLVGDDTTCIDYLTNIDTNWKEIKPLPMEFDQRTIKFEAVFHALRLQDGQHRAGAHLVKSILKVPQRLFPNEAFSEVASYHADRVLGINRIPPTGWVCIPEKTIRASVQHYATSTETVEEFLQESNAANYSDWVEKDLFDYARSEKLFSHTADGRRCIYASIQLKVSDVFHLLDSALKIPYKAHNDSWHGFFNLADNHDPMGRPSFYSEYYAVSLLHISELCTFDYAIGNGDRSPNKNNFVVGGCTRKSECDERGKGKYVFHPNHPTYVHLDQGMGFYGTPKRNPIKDSIHPTDPLHFCFFRAPLLSRIDALVQDAPGEDGKEAGKRKSRFEAKMWQVLPKGIRQYITERKLKASAESMRAVLALARRCLEQPYAAYVLGP